MHTNKVKPVVLNKDVVYIKMECFAHRIMFPHIVGNLELGIIKKIG